MYCHFISNNNCTTDSSCWTVSVSNINKTNYGFQLESNVTNGNLPSEIAYRNPQHGIFMLFPSNWTFSTSGLPEYTQIGAFYAPLQNLSDPIPARLTITVMSVSTRHISQGLY